LIKALAASAGLTAAIWLPTAAGAAGAAGAAMASESSASAGFDYCAPPVRPACVEDRKTYSDPRARRACEDETNRYVASAFKYRDCMYAAIERAVRQTNETIGRLRCREASQTPCP
jgi:hypothetical protein